MPTSNIIAKIEAYFGLTTAVRNPFVDMLEELTGPLLFDPFNLSVGDEL
jgi:hypothetical protein